MTTHTTVTTPAGGSPRSTPAPSPELSDADLRAWRDAALAGGWPAPSRSDRWQPLRAGVTGLWEFEASEYWYAGGWCQLTGRNETGKSSLMALTTLIPWLGDTATANIDTLGDHGKRFRYYVEPTGGDSDRRDATASTNRGWLWVEFGRRSAANEAEYLTTLLFADARRAGGLTLTWVTAQGPRVRDGLVLERQRIITTAAELRDLPGVSVHPTATRYRQRCADLLLGGDHDRLVEIGRLLRVIRTPKLGERLDISFVSERMRDALPELDRTEIDALAAGWDQLDEVRADAESAKDAVAVVRKLITGAWQPWADARIRRTADEAAAARTAFDAVTRRVREATGELAAVQEQVADGARRRDEHERTEAATSAAREELRASTRYADAAARLDRARAAEDAAERARHAAEGTAREADRAADRAAASRELARRDEEALAPLAAERDRATTATRDALASAGLDRHDDAVPGDLPRLRQAVADRRTAVRRARDLLGAFARADQRAEHDEAAAERESAAARDARERAEASWAAAEQSRDALARLVAAWAAGVVPQPQDALVDAWIAALPARVAAVSDSGAGDRPREGGLTGGGDRLRDAIARDWFTPAHAAAQSAMVQARTALATLEAREADLRARIAQVEAAPTPALPEPIGWARRERPAPGPEGAPFWRVVDPTDAAPLDDLAAIEAALAATGLLDAWVTPDGAYLPDRDGHDALVLDPTAGAHREPADRHDAPAPASAAGDAVRLSSVLVVAEDWGPLAGVTRRVLDDVALVAGGAPLPTYGHAVSRDGRWRTPLRSGTARPLHPHAEWLGEDARRRARDRLLAELRAELAALAPDLAAARDALQAAQGATRTLQEAHAAAPDDGALRALLVQADEREQRATEAARRADAAADRARTSRATADEARATLLEYAAAHALPHDAAGLDGVADRLHDLEGAVGVLDRALLAHRAAADRAAASRQRALDDGQDQDRAGAAAAQAAAEAHAAGVAAQTLRAALGADAEAVFAEVARLDRELARVQAALRALAGEERDLAARDGRAREVLERAEQDREAATVRRDVAFGTFRRLVDSGLVAEAGVDLPQPEAATVEAVRAQVAAAREQSRPRDWPEDADAQQQRLDGAWARLASAGEEARSALESGGRTLYRRGEDDLPRLEIVVDATGVGLAPRAALNRLGQIRAELEQAYDQRVQQVLAELLGSTFIEHLRDHLVAARRLIRDINRVLGEHATGTTGTTLRISLAAVEGSTAAVVAAVEDGQALLDDDTSAQVRAFLRARVDGAKEAAAAHGEADWRGRLAETLDYRRWFAIRLDKRSGEGGRWSPLTPSSYAELSGGAKAVMLMLPLVATLAALYDGRPSAPRPVWLDEAFGGLDPENTAMVLDLLRQFDFDVLVAGPGRLLNVGVVPVAAIYQVVRAPQPYPGADLTVELWAGRELQVLDLPARLATSGADGVAVAPDLLGLIGRDDDDDDSGNDAGGHDDATSAAADGDGHGGDLKGRAGDRW